MTFNFRTPSGLALATLLLALSFALIASHVSLASGATSVPESFLRIQTVAPWAALRRALRVALRKDRPKPSVFRPLSWATGTAVIIVPGGVCLALARDLEGRSVADWYAPRVSPRSFCAMHQTDM